MASPEKGIWQTSSLQHRKQGLVLSPPPFSTRDGYGDVSQGIKGRGQERQVEETLATLSFSPASGTTQLLHFARFSVCRQRPQGSVSKIGSSHHRLHRFHLCSSSSSSSLVVVVVVDTPRQESNGIRSSATQTSSDALLTQPSLG